jgi:hypothetical protein
MQPEKARNAFLSLSPNRATAEIGWHRRQSAYNDEYIDQIVDPSESVKKVLTAIPSPFARIHLVDSAFHFVNARDKQQVPKHDGNSVFHKLVSDCLDVLELLFGWNTMSADVQTSYWSRDELQKVQSSVGQRLLASVLDLFLQQDAKTAKFELQPDFILMSVGHQTIAISSPLTLFITSPRAAEIAVKAKLLNPGSGRIYFGDPVPLYRRSAEFQKYVHWMFQQNPVLHNACRRMYRYVNDSIELLTDRTLEESIRAIVNGPDNLGQNLDTISDYRGMPLTVNGVQLRQRKSKDALDRLRKSPMVIASPRWPTRLGNPPLVLDGQSDSFGRQVKIDLRSVSNDARERVLPDLGVRYPFLVASDLIEDQVIRVPYKLNSERFFLPDSRSLKNIECDYLPPLKPAFFEYFDADHIPKIAKFLPTSSGGLAFQVEVPTAGGKVTLSKSYYESPEGTRPGRIVEAKMNCAVFPLVATRNRPDLSDRYWVMLVDAEIEPELRNQDCFVMKFFSKNDNQAEADALLYKEIGRDMKGLQHVSVVRRSPKGAEASSTYFRIEGGPFDYITLEAFASDSVRRARALIVPRWVEREIGQRRAVVGIDFGTTNTHVAWIYEDDKRPTPNAFTVDSQELQMALLSAPSNSATSESAKYDEFDSSLKGTLLTGTKIRLHHEFLPNIIGSGGSPFSFPLRTATCEAPGLQAGQYQPLMNVNISFMFEREAKRHGEEEINTNLKWSLQASPEVEKRVEAFIEELLVLIRTKLILKGVDPQESRVVWFRPLSFGNFTKNHFNTIWEDKVKDVLKSKNLLRCITESEAPYYYHQKAASVITSKPTICVDIGGGSTDVVFFHDDKPQIGTSFSFAGNALWGAGYDEVNKTQTGVVRKFGPEVKRRITQIGNAEDRRRIEGVYGELQGQPCEEIVNFFFSIDKYVEFSKALSHDAGVRCLILLHYAAIIFHCAQVMHAKGMPEPEYVCLSGRGARSLDILDPSSDHRHIALLTHALFEKTYGVTITEPIKVLLAADSKEATCNGGVLKSPGDKSEPDTVVYIGDGKTIGELTSEQIDSTIRGGVAQNLGAFADSIAELSKSLAFSKLFGVKEGDFDWIATELKRKVVDYIDFGLKRHGYQANPKERINETLFFYPLVQKLFEIGNRLIVNDMDAKGTK